MFSITDPNLLLASNLVSAAAILVVVGAWADHLTRKLLARFRAD